MARLRNALSRASREWRFAASVGLALLGLALVMSTVDSAKARRIAFERLEMVTTDARTERAALQSEIDRLQELVVTVRTLLLAGTDDEAVRVIIENGGKNGGGGGSSSSTGGSTGGGSGGSTSGGGGGGSSSGGSGSDGGSSDGSSDGGSDGGSSDGGSSDGGSDGDEPECNGVTVPVFGCVE